MAGNIAALIDAAASKYGVPGWIARGVAEAESSMGQNPLINRPGAAGELGVMQLTPAIVQKYGVADPRNAEQSIDAGVHDLADLYRATGDWREALRRYNGSYAYADNILRAAMAGGAGQAGSPLDQMLSQYASMIQGNQAAMQQRGAQMEASDAESEKRLRRISAEEDALAGQIGAKPQPQAPNAPNLPNPPQPPTPNPTRVFGQFMPMLAAFGGLFVKNNAAAALKAGAAAMEAANNADDKALQEAHDLWKESTQKALDAWQGQREAYQDAMEAWKTGNETLLQKAELKAREFSNELMGQAIKDKDWNRAWQIMQGGETAAYHVMGIMSQEQRLNAQLQNQNPANVAYNRAYDQAISAGKSQEDAAKAGEAALQETEFAIHPTARAAQGRAEQAAMERDPKIKTYRTTSQYFSELDSIKPEDMNTAQGQIKILDSFTKLATGGQAIRQFMAQSVTKYLGWINQAEALYNRATTTHGAVMSEQAAKQFYDGAKELREELTKNYYHALADHANEMQNRGTDPALGGIPPEDLQAIMESGQFAYDPKKIGGEPMQEQQSKYTVGQIITHGGKRYKITKVDPNDPDNPDIEPVK